MQLLIVLLLIIIVPWLIAALFLRGENLCKFDRNDDADAVRLIEDKQGPSEEHRKIAEEVGEFGEQAGQMARPEQVHFTREFMDKLCDGRVYASDFVAVDVAGVPAEWVLAPGADPANRVLYLHGGAFIAGSRRSHRNITNRLSEIAGASVLAIDYRLMPENRRSDGIADCRKAYRWILDNGPEGGGPVARLVISGDSAGGNLALSLVAWARDKDLRAADAVVAFSPAVDATHSSPSIRSNVSSDIMLGPFYGDLLKIPQAVRAWLHLLEIRFNPANPVVSPVMGDLSNLPPTLIQVSEAEMLLDDARRYVRKARASGSPAVAQCWPHMLHVWQIYYPEMPEAVQAFQEVRQFLQSLENAREAEGTLIPSRKQN
jgi:acetyl esterase/lipase